MNEHCTEYREKIAGILDGQTTSVDMAAVEEHLSGCPDCRQFHQDLLNDDRLLTEFVRSADDEVARLEGLVMNTIDAANANASIPERESSQREHKESWWSATFFRSGYVKVAAAAAVILAIIVGANLIDRPGGSNMVWADMMQQVEDAEDFICRIYQTNTADPRGPIEMVEYRSQKYGMRADIYRDDILAAAIYMQPKSSILYTIVYRDRTYALSELPEEARKEMMENGGARGLVQYFRSFEFKELGRKEFDGVMTSGIEVVNPTPFQAVMDSTTIRLWVDVETNWPARIEFDAVAKGGDVRVNRIMDDFHWNPTLSKEDFEFEIPDDYQLLGRMEAPKGDQKHAIESLRMYAEITSGRYPSVLSYATAMYEAEDDFERSKRSGTDSQDLLSSYTRILDACHFYAELEKQEQDPAWYGEDVNGRDFDKVLMRWRLEDGRYRVIYGDLRTEDVSAERLAELEGK